jgi:blue copper oxidase
MKRFLLLLAFIGLCAASHAQYNTLWIPETLSGTEFNLALRDTFAQLRPGNQTITGGINGSIWGPTLILEQGDTVHMNITNHLNDSTTIHWHGMHLPAVMDGGPHQVIPPNTVWQPYWKVTNKAATLWYHPHLHMMTEEQITKGLGGLIIVHDAEEAALNLPRTYGVDDIPVVLTDRDFTSANQFSVVPYGDSLLANFTLRAQYTIPAQVVRFRLLNGAIERSYNIGFSDNRTFSVIGTDGGLLNAPVSVTRYLLSAGERVEILVDCSGQNGTTVDLKAFNSTLSNFVPGGESFPNGPFANALGHIDFRLVHLNIGAATATPVTAVPTALANNVYPSATDADLTRIITLSDSTGVSGILGPNAFILGHHLFDINLINHHVPLNNTEIWQLQSSSIFAHPFHIHDVEFYILSRNGVAPPAYEQGWKDVVLVKGNETVKFIARFDDYADALHPFMYHCHIALHEDEGMMGQFVVDESTSVTEKQVPTGGFSIYPNPSKEQIKVAFDNASSSAYYVKIFDNLGRTILMLPQPNLHHGIDVSNFKPGVYFLSLTDLETKQVTTKPFIKE